MPYTRHPSLFEWTLFMTMLESHLTFEADESSKNIILNSMHITVRKM